ncbi:MAG: hypothetical protein WC761_00910 [Candidatus Paceibacterota bacterium]|jgi:hypothetical protein
MKQLFVLKSYAEPSGDTLPSVLEQKAKEFKAAYERLYGPDTCEVVVLPAGTAIESIFIPQPPA